MRSLKTRLIVVILAVVIVSSALIGTIGLHESFRATDSIVQTQVEDRLAVTATMLHLYLQEQAESTAQINEGVEQISAVVQNNAATAEQSAATSDELTAQSVTMQELVSRFQLRDSVSARSDSPAETETCSTPEDIPAPVGSKY